MVLAEHRRLSARLQSAGNTERRPAIIQIRAGLPSARVLSGRCKRHASRRCSSFSAGKKPVLLSSAASA